MSMFENSRHKIWLRVISLFLIQAFVLSNAQVSFAAFDNYEKSQVDTSTLAPKLSLPSFPVALFGRIIKHDVFLDALRMPFLRNIFNYMKKSGKLCTVGEITYGADVSFYEARELLEWLASPDRQTEPNGKFRGIKKIVSENGEAFYQYVDPDAEAKNTNPTDLVEVNENFRLLQNLPKLLEDFDIKNLEQAEAILCRVNVNVPAEADGSIKDTTRLDNTKKLIEFLLSLGLTPVLYGHLGSLKFKKDGEPIDKRQSLEHVANYIQKLFPNTPVVFHKGQYQDDTVLLHQGWTDITKDEDGNDIKIVPNAINIINNVRLDAREEGTALEQRELGHKLMNLAGPNKILISDAFGDITSIGSSIQYVPHFANNLYLGPEMLEEFEQIKQILEGIDGLVFGGEKLKKLVILKSLLKIIREGGFALVASGPSTELDAKPELIKELEDINADAFIKTDDYSDDTHYDIGPKTLANFLRKLDRMREGQTIFVNGTMGFMEEESGKYQHGTEQVWNKLGELAQLGVKIVVGGGDAGKTSRMYGLDKQPKVVIISGGGVALELLAGTLLSGIEALAARQVALDHKDEGRRIVAGFNAELLAKAPSTLVENLASLVITEQKYVDAIKLLLDINQGNLFLNWDIPGINDVKKIKFLEQIIELDNNYPGGLKAHQENAKELLKKAASGENPFDGFIPEVPEGIQIAGVDDNFRQKQLDGLSKANKTAFIMVAGGVGDRLGYDGIKIEIPVSLTDMETYLKVYIDTILAMQEKSNRINNTDDRIPFVIMTSNDTHDMTLDLLTEMGYSVSEKQGPQIGYWALEKEDSTLYIVKQGMVPAMVSNEADFILDENDPYLLATKPHGHGDVHMLLYQAGLVSQWADKGITHAAFIQDTNAQVMNGILPALSVSHSENFDFNFITVPREAGEAAGSIAKLVKEDGTSMIGNVEYNQISPLLRSIGKDDVPDESGKSPFPGNLNVFIVEIKTYNQTLQRTRGIIGEFVNPKYADEKKMDFNKPARLETMMQDLAFEMKRVGFTNFRDKRLVFSPVKNNLKDAAEKPKKGNYPDAMPTGEADFHKVFRQFLEQAGVSINVEAGEKVTRQGIPYLDGAKIVLKPKFAITVKELQAKVEGGSISDNSTLNINGENVLLRNVDLDGALIINASDDAAVIINRVNISNKGWDFVELSDSQMQDIDVPAGYKIRGYVLHKKGECSINIKGEGRFIFENLLIRGKVEIISEYQGVFEMDSIKEELGFKMGEQLILENIVINIDKDGNVKFSQNFTNQPEIFVSEDRVIIIKEPYDHSHVLEGVQQILQAI